MRKIFIITLVIFCSLQISVFAQTEVNRKQRFDLYHQVAEKYGVLWTYIAAVDQYERSLRLAEGAPENISNISISYAKKEWRKICRFAFGGGVASQNCDEDLLFLTAMSIKSFGLKRQDFKIWLWEKYHSDWAILGVLTNLKLFEKYGDKEIYNKVFPLSASSKYRFSNNWQSARSWGGERLHEGIDIMADEGTPIYSVCYGVLESKGWNIFGGWRVGVRDINNIYYYYAHLNALPQNIEIGDIIEAGQQIGCVGSTGYGAVGTSGKFLPHLHFGLYMGKIDGEDAFNPYPFLKQWEK